MFQVKKKMEYICYKRGDYMEFAKRLDTLIENGSIPVYELSKRIGVTRQQIARWRAGTSEAGVTKLKAICEIYGVSADYILGLPQGLNWPIDPKPKERGICGNTHD